MALNSRAAMGARGRGRGRGRGGMALRQQVRAFRGGK